MEKTKHKKQKRYYDFLSSSKYLTSISLVLFLISVFLILQQGLSYGIDFKGGTEVQIKFQESQDLKKLKTDVKKYLKNEAVIQKIGDEEKEFIIRLTGLSSLGSESDQQGVNNKLQSMVSALVKGLSNSYSGMSVQRIDTIGPQVGERLKQDGLLALFYAFLIILIYIGLRFDFTYSLSSVVCLVHDAVITLGVLVILQKEINLQTLAAVLTIIGYSLNDTIVTFDRIRENLDVQTNWSLKKIMNTSLNQILSRSLLTSITTLLAVVTMFFVADGVIRDVSFTLIVGVVIGTFSSIYIATPLAYWLIRIQDDLKKEAA